MRGKLEEEPPGSTDFGVVGVALEAGTSRTPASCNKHRTAAPCGSHGWRWKWRGKRNVLGREVAAG
ncbi:MAG: hypothetical protein EOO65_05600 [Methanosarcinales archaeon]|nr:MAG: hypothetical protein EOO65_05600 [Methanosarcinales archaeon]